MGREDRGETRSELRVLLGDFAMANGIVLTHGAGANSNTALLKALDAEFAALGWTVVRYDLPFRQARPSGPPRPADGAKDRAGLKEQVEKLRAAGCERVYLGGHSYGGRQASMLASEEPGVVDALLLLSYPLHPPAKPEQMRTAHFPALGTPALFVSGQRDEFGTVDEFETAAKLIPGRVRIDWHEKVGHSLNPKLAAAIAAAFELFARS